MPSHLDTIRKIHARATAYPGLGGMFPKIDNDLEEEAGMDGNLQRLLQAARDLDAAETPAPAPTAHTPEPWATRRNDDGSALAYEITVNHGKGLVAYVVGYNVYDGTDDPETEANAVRIVAAVNACAGITDPGPTLASIAGFLEDVVNGCDPDEARTIAAELLALLGAK